MAVLPFKDIDDGFAFLAVEMTRGRFKTPLLPLTYFQTVSTSGTVHITMTLLQMQAFTWPLVSGNIFEVDV